MHPIIENAKKEGRQLLESEAKDLLSEYDVSIPPYRLATSENEAADYAHELGYPVAMKIASPDILHKTDAGGVKLNIHNAAEARSAFCALQESAREYDPDARISGALVTPMVPQGVEVIVGMTRDPQFGPVVMFGLGGIFVEIFKDVSFRVTPFDRDEARSMIEEIKAYPILKGARGEKTKDIDAITDLIMKVASFSDDFDEVRELDLNPVFAYEDGLSVVDACIVI
jgi:acetyl-CoA synthetase (ADP-forming)